MKNGRQLYTGIRKLKFSPHIFADTNKLLKTIINLGWLTQYNQKTHIHESVLQLI